jgi:hypothetical protein
LRRIFQAILAVLALGGCALAIVVSWFNRQQYEAAIAPLVSVPADPAMRELEHRWGFSRIDTRFVVQVTPVGDPFDMRESMWSAYEVDRREGEPPLPAGARGIALEWSEDDALALDDVNRHLGARLARSPEEILWVAFVHRSSVVNVYTYERMRSDRASPTLERLDIRVVRRDGRALVGRLSAEAIPPARASSSQATSRYTVRGWTVAEGLDALLSDTRIAVPDPSPPLPTECFADRLPPLEEDDDFDVGCTDGATQRCISACLAGSAGSCVRTGWALEQGWWHRPDEIFRRACMFGSPRGCASFAATWLERAPSDPLAQSCAAALLERACAAGDAYGCRVGESLGVHAAHP